MGRHDQLHLTYPSKTMYQMLAETARRNPQLPACRYLGRSISYARLMQRIARAARGFYAMGIRRGDRVALCLPNCPQAVECLYALNRLGAAAVMIHPLSAPREIRTALETARSGVLVIPDRLFPAADAARRGLPGVTLVVLGRAGGVAGQLGWRRLLAAGRGLRLPQDTGRAEDPAVILFSGGTTGTPKAVVLSNLNFNALALQMLAAGGFGDVTGMKLLAVLPLFHGFGLGVGVHTPLLGGACCVLVPRFRAEACARLLLREKPQIIPGVPALFEALLQQPRLQKADLGFLRGVFCGGDRLAPELKARMDAFLAARGAPARLREGYGLTECVTACCLAPPEGCPPESMGLPLPDTLCAVCRPGTTEVLPPGVEGEICLTGPTVMVEYMGNPDETARALRRHGDNRIWLHTGDLGYRNAEGFLCFTQRLKRVIVTRGYNVYPARLEAVLEEYPGVRAACVIGVADPRKGQRVRAYVVGSGLTREDLLAHCRDRVARYALPEEIVFRSELPRTKLGKVDYHKLEEEA